MSALSQQTIYQRQVMLPSVSMTTADLMAIATKAHNLLQIANQSATTSGSSDTWSESLEISDGNRSVRVTDFTLAQIPKAPAVSYSAYFHSTSSLAAPVSYVQLDLRDYHSELVVSGISSDQVDEIVSTVQASLEPYSTYGGLTSRTHLGFAAFVVLCFLAILAAERNRNSVLVVSILLMAVMILLYVTPNHILPGTALYAENASFWNVHSSIIAALALVSSILAIISWFFNIWKWGKQNVTVSRDNSK